MKEAIEKIEEALNIIQASGKCGLAIPILQQATAQLQAGAEASRLPEGFKLSEFIEEMQTCEFCCYPKEALIFKKAMGMVNHLIAFNRIFDLSSEKKVLEEKARGAVITKAEREALDWIYKEQSELKKEGIQNFDGYYLTYDKFFDAIKQAWPDEKHIGYLEDPLELVTRLIDERDEAKKLLSDALPHIECTNASQNGLITAIGEFLQTEKDGTVDKTGENARKVTEPDEKADQVIEELVAGAEVKETKTMNAKKTENLGGYYGPFVCETCGKVFGDKQDCDALGSDSGICCPDCRSEDFISVVELLAKGRGFQELTKKNAEWEKWVQEYIATAINRGRLFVNLD